MALTMINATIVEARASSPANAIDGSWTIRLRDVDHLGRDVDQRHDRPSHDQSAAPRNDEGVEGKLHIKGQQLDHKVNKPEDENCLNDRRRVDRELAKHRARDKDSDRDTGE
jgi:hypothetical protein